MLTWPVVTKVVDVHTENYRRVLCISDWLYRIHERVFAMEATITVVHLVCRVFHFMGMHFLPRQTPFVGKTSTIMSFRTSQRR